MQPELKRSISVSNTNSLFNPVTDIFSYMVVNILTGLVRWVVSVDDGRQTLPILFQRQMSKGIGALIRLFAIGIKQVVDVNPQHALAIIPRLHDFVVNPISLGCL